MLLLGEPPAGTLTAPVVAAAGGLGDGSCHGEGAALLLLLEAAAAGSQASGAAFGRLGGALSADSPLSENALVPDG